MAALAILDTMALMRKHRSPMRLIEFCLPRHAGGPVNAQSCDEAV